jgi:multiple sugar transport system substrate-binding protein
MEENGGSPRVASTSLVARRQFLWRTLVAGATLPSAATLLAACGGSSESSTSAAGTAPVTIRYQKGPHSADDLRIQDAFAKRWTADHPNFTIKNSLYDWAQMDPQLTSEFASGSPPELTYQVDIVYPKFAQAGSLLDIGSYVQRDDYKAERSAYFPQFWDLATFDGKTWGVPFLNAPLALFINKDLLKKAGVTDWQSSYAALRAAARQATSGDTYGFSFRSTDIADVAFLDWMVYVHNAGARILDDAKTAGALDTPEMVETMQFLQDVYVTDKSAPPAGKYGQDGLRALFQAGKIAIHHDQSDFALQLAAREPGFAWDVAMVPPGPKAQTTFGNSGFICISAGAKDPDAAWEYLKYLTGKDLVVDYMTQTNFAATRKDSAALLFKRNAILNRIANEFVPKEVPFQTHPRMGEMLAAAWQDVEAILRGQKSADEGIKHANEQITSIAQS